MPVWCLEVALDLLVLVIECTVKFSKSCVEQKCRPLQIIIRIAVNSVRRGVFVRLVRVFLLNIT